jgi:outer membrane protein TolC
MRRTALLLQILALLFLGLPALSLAAPLTLEAVLAEVDAPHPELRVSEARHALARADQQLAASLDDLSVTLDATLRSGRNPALGGYAPDHLARLNIKKTLLDAGRFEALRGATENETAAAFLQHTDLRAQRRITLMARFFDVLLADLAYAADSEFMAVAYVRWDNGKDLHQLGQISTPQWLDLEARYQELRLRRNDSERRMREKRALLAMAMNRPGDLASEVVDPALTGNNRALPEFDNLLVHLTAHNPKLAALRLQLEAARLRVTGVRASDGPRLEAEAEAGAYSRDASTRDSVRAGINLVWPLSQGRRTDGEIAREQARLQQLQAEADLLALNLRQALYDTWQEIQLLRDVERKTTQAQAVQRDWALERARAEYELELKTNLGVSMAETQAARLLNRSVEYRLALAWARMDALLGVPLDYKEKKR